MIKASSTVNVISMAAFVRRHLPFMLTPERKAREKFTNWLSWSMGRTNICCIQDGGKIRALGVAKAIASTNDAGMSYASDEKGMILYVQLAIAKDTEAFKSLLRYCQGRWPHCTEIMFNRKKYRKRVIYNFKNFLRKAGV